MNIEPIKTEQPLAVMFDWAGVLVYDAFAILENVDITDSYAGDDWGFPRGTITSAKNILWPRLALGEITEEQFWELMVKRIGENCSIPLHGGITFVSTREYLQRIRERLIDAHTPYPYSFHLAEMHRADGIPVGLATNNCREWLKIWKNQYGLEDMFDPVVASCDIGKMKPEPAFYLEMMKQLYERHGITDSDSNRRRVVVYDDQERNAVAARDLGLHGVVHKPLSRP